MGKISPVAAKYIIKAKIVANGVVEKPDAIGAVFGQTEGLLGSDLELRELQKSGRIGRIDVYLRTKGGKTRGTVEIPSSMDKSETAIIAAALETIDRIGPCEAEVTATAVEDVRERKRKFIVDRAKKVLKDMLMDGPDSQELLGEVTEAVRQAELVHYGREKLPAGPAVATEDEVILVEGRADVLTLLRHGIKNALALGGNKMPKTVVSLSKSKELTLFVDGDRGGDLIVKEVLMLADIDYVAYAPDGKEVEELAKKEIHKALRGKVSAKELRKKKDIKLEKSGKSGKKTSKKTKKQEKKSRKTKKSKKASKSKNKSRNKRDLSADEKKQFKKLMEDLVGTRGAYLLKETEILGKVPIVELGRYLEILKADTVVMDGKVTRKVAGTCRKYNVETVVGKEVVSGVSDIDAFTKDDL